MSYSAQFPVDAKYILADGYTPSLNAILPKNDLILSGSGYLGGDFPDYVTKVEGVPTKTEILVFERSTSQLVQHIKTEITGSWRVSDLNPDLRFDVICRFDGYKDEVISGVQPFVE